MSMSIYDYYKYVPMEVKVAEPSTLPTRSVHGTIIDYCNILYVH